MGKALLSTIILFVTIVVTIILVTIVFDRHPEFGTFSNLVWLGLTFFLCGLGIILAAVILEKAIREQAS